MKEEIISFARSMIGTKWRHMGRTSRGVDCLGLLLLSLKAGGFEPKYEKKYGREPWKDGLQEALVDHFGDPVIDWQPGDIALIKFDQSPDPSHVGILADYKYGGLSLIHSYSLISVTEHRLDAAWAKRIVEVYRPWQQ